MALFLVPAVAQAPCPCLFGGGPCRRVGAHLGAASLGVLAASSPGQSRCLTPSHLPGTCAPLTACPSPIMIGAHKRTTTPISSPDLRARLPPVGAKFEPVPVTVTVKPPFSSLLNWRLLLWLQRLPPFVLGPMLPERSNRNELHFPWNPTV